MALALLASKAFPPERLVAFTVDHRLASRGLTESPLTVIQSLLAMGLHQHQILPLDWSPVLWDALTKGKMLEKTRNMRYEALLQACRKWEVPLLMTAHTLDDDVITMFYRMAHQSGIDGMAGMKRVGVFPVGDPTSHSAAASRFFLGHPLLSIPKARLDATCKAASLPIVQDASNNDMDFRRNAISRALSLAQDQRPALTTEALQRTLENVKRVRADMHAEVAAVMERSVIINKVNGDATLILNDRTWLHRRPIATRVIMALLQFASVNHYPSGTPSINALYDMLVAAYAEHEKEQRRWISKMPEGVRNAELQPIDKTKRLMGLRQHTLGGCTFLSLSRTDAMRRIALQEKLESRKMEYGPAFLIQREPPSNCHLHAPGLHPTQVKLGPNETHLWDGRIHLSFEHVPSLSAPMPTGSRTFSISFMTPGDVKEFEALTRGMPAARRRVYAYMAITPGSHLYQVPVVREVGNPGYMAFPTLQAEYPSGTYKWKTSHAGNLFLTSRFLCLP